MNKDRNAHGEMLALSVVAPMHNEAGGASRLVEEIAVALNGFDHEIIIVDDASTDETLAQLHAAAASYPQLRILKHEKNAGQSRALRSGVLAACSAIVATLDGDGQNDPADILSLLEKKKETGAAMAAGERQGRQDSSAKKFASRAANAVRGRLLRDGAADTGCGLKVFDRDAFLRLPYFDHMHRYLPALMRREGYAVVFVPVSHRARSHGRSKYSNLGRLLVAFRDVLGVLWLLARAKSPGKVEEDGPK
jgi:dolichol-phosphate mannosyltransferase